MTLKTQEKAWFLNGDRPRIAYDPDLAAIIAAWPSLPPAICAATAALARTAV